MNYRFLLTTLFFAVVLLSACNKEDDMVIDDQPPEENLIDTLMTADGIQFVRTPEDAFQNLPDWPYTYQYLEIDGLRQAYAESGPADGEVVLLLHGQPSWSYLYRSMIPVLADAGYRVIAMDHLGMGRSDKPIDIADYSYLGHGDRLERFILQLGLSDINLFVQDWGSLIGLRGAGLNPGWFASISVGNGSLPVIPQGMQPLPPIANPNEIEDLPSPFAAFPPQQTPFYDGCDLIDENSSFDFEAWAVYSMKGASYKASEVVEALTWFDLSQEVEDAYDAPFPSREYMAGTRVFPALVNEVGGVNAEAWAGLTSYTKPFLTIWGDNDNGNLGTCEAQQTFIDNVPGAAGKPHTRISQAGHFLQSDQGVEIANRLVEFYAFDWANVSTNDCENFNSPIPNQGRTQMLIPPANFRDFQYCEVLPVFECGDDFVTEVYASVGHNDCPDADWFELNAAELKDQFGMVDVRLNGPRHWVLNSVEANANGQTNNYDKIALFGNIEMSLQAQIQSAFSEGDLYTESEVLRTTTYTYLAGNEVYKLINPQGEEYIMQSYSRLIDQDQTIDDLATLGSRLNLPSGWSFLVEVLQADFLLVTEGQAFVITDDFDNAYQKIVD
ncbi:MAG: alpha/beta fold hydrolase [Saprospiraceae bacterium]|nr:alpha/beta fold hydrolase [Saprospiraceae bacterium]